MKDIVTTILNLDEVFENMNIAETIELLSSIIEYKKDLEKLKRKVERTIELNQYFEISNDEEQKTLSKIETQLHYIDMNIRVLENALLCHETKIFQKRTIYGKFVMDFKFILSLN